jgi:NADH-ubiquinone oxidoreductase chain 2
MILLSILILIICIAVPSSKKQFTPVFFTRITSLLFIYSGVLSFNTYYIHEIGGGVGIFSGLFQVSLISQLFDSFIFFIAALILIGWPVNPLYIFRSNIRNNKFTDQENKLIESKVNELSISLPKLSKAQGGSNLQMEYKVIDRSSYPVEYSLIILFSTLGSSLLVSSADLLSMYLSIELQSFALYILATLFRDSESSTFAGLKYFLLGALSSCFILLGAGLVYSYTGLTNFESIYILMSVYGDNSTLILQGLSLGLILIIIGFLFKIAAAPLHNWAPDVYDDTPNLVTIWLTIMPKIAILILMLELYTQISLPDLNMQIPALDSGFSNLISLDLSNGIILNENTSALIKKLLLISSLLSLVIGTVLGLSQYRIKRLLAYSTISHLGFILLALAINSEQSIESFIFYLIQYSLTNLNTFLIIIAFGYIIQTNWKKSTISYYSLIKENEFDLKYLSELKGQFYANPLLSLSLSISLFSMAGIPPLIGFFSKQFVLYSAIESGYYFLAFVCVIVSVISASYYLKLIKLMFISSDSLTLNENKENNENNKIKFEYLISNLHSFIISSVTLSILFFVVKSSLLLNSTQVLSLSLFNY